MSRGGARVGSGRTPTLVAPRRITMHLDEAAARKVEAWRSMLGLSRAEAIRLLIAAAPTKPRSR